jgi:hypothetical protein
MSTPSRDPLLTGLESEVQAEIELVESSRPAVASTEPTSQWPFDPSDIAREEVGLRSILGAVGALERAGRGDSDGVR